MDRPALFLPSLSRFLPLQIETFPSSGCRAAAIGSAGLNWVVKLYQFAPSHPTIAELRSSSRF